MSHDLLAELTGYRNELTAVSGERAEAVKGEIERVTAEIRQKAEALDARAEAHDEGGQDVPAAEARVEARQLRDAIAESGPEPGEDTAGTSEVPAGATARGRGRTAKKTENAADSTPRETADGKK
jgi:hypothetical protein